MRSYIPAFDLRVPRDLSEALVWLEEDPGAEKPFAGGTDLMVLLEAGRLAHHKFVSIWKLPELRGIEVTPTHVTLGALTTYTQVQRNETLQREFPLLWQAASLTGTIATQNRGTLGGNIANASPAADSPPALLVYDAELELVSASATRRVPYHGFCSGYKQMDLRPDELIRAVHLPRHPAWRQHYRKVGARRAQAISKVCFAAAASLENGKIADVRLAFGSVAPIVQRVTQTENLLRNEKPSRELLKAARESLGRELTPIDDIRSTARYRARVAQNLLAEFMETLLF